MTTPVCKRCNDTHNVENSFGERRMCTDCPTPCGECRSHGVGAYCEHTPCNCACHKKGQMITSKEQTISSIWETIQGGKFTQKDAELLAAAIHSDPCRFLSAADAASLRRGILLGKEAEDRKDAIITGLTKQRDMAIKACEAERSARFEECNKRNNEIAGLKGSIEAMTIQARVLENLKDRVITERDIAVRVLGEERNGRIADNNAKDEQISALAKQLFDADKEVARARQGQVATFQTLSDEIYLLRKVKDSWKKRHDDAYQRGCDQVREWSERALAAEAKRDENFNKYKNACEAVHDLDIKYAVCKGDLERATQHIEQLVRMRNDSTKAYGEMCMEISNLKSEIAGNKVARDKLQLKITNQRERINYLEGATHHACGTPLTIATRELEAERAKVAELRGIVETLRNDKNALVPDRYRVDITQGAMDKLKREYEDCKMLLRSLGHSNYDNAAKRLGEIISEYSDTAHINTVDARRWRALLASARIRGIGSSGLEEPTQAPPGYAHLGLELTTICSYDPKELERENKIGKEWLIKYADIMLEVLAKKNG